MELKRSIIVLVIFIVLSCIAGFVITFSVTRSKIVKVSVYDLSGSLTKLENWQKWNTALIDKNKKVSIIDIRGDKPIQLAAVNGKPVLKLTVMNPVFLVLERQDNNSLQFITLQAADKDSETIVSLTTSENVFGWLKEKITGNDDISAELDDLKKFAESTQGMYGFPILHTKVTDIIICTKKETISTAISQPQIDSLLTSVRQFLKSHNIGDTKGYYYVSSSSLLGGKTELAVGVPVKSKITPENGIEFLKFPTGGNLLVGTFEGRFADIHKIYTAMDKYVEDKKMNKVAQPMEKYTDAPASLNTKRNITMQLIYPVY